MYKKQHSTVTALYRLNKTVATGFKQMAPQRYEQSFRHDKHKHTNQKLLHTNIPGTIIQFIANYIKVRKAYATYKSHTSIRHFKIGVSHSGVLSPKLLNIYTADIPPHRAPVQVRHVICRSHHHHMTRVQTRNTYNHTYIEFLLKQNIPMSH